MTNLLVTGDRGYIGSIFCQRALKTGMHVTGYDIGLYDDYYLVKNNLGYIYIHVEYI